MSDYMIRQLAAACAPRIAAKVEAGVLQIVRDELPSIVADVLREQYSGETIQLYVAKRSSASRRDRDNAIRAAYTGHNSREVAAKFGVSIRMVQRLVAGGRK